MPQSGTRHAAHKETLLSQRSPAVDITRHVLRLQNHGGLAYIYSATPPRRPASGKAGLLPWRGIPYETLEKVWAPPSRMLCFAFWCFPSLSVHLQLVLALTVHTRCPRALSCLCCVCSGRTTAAASIALLAASTAAPTASCVRGAVVAVLPFTLLHPACASVRQACVVLCPLSVCSRKLECCGCHAVVEWRRVPISRDVACLMSTACEEAQRWSTWLRSQGVGSSTLYMACPACFSVRSHRLFQGDRAAYGQHGRNHTPIHIHIRAQLPSSQITSLQQTQSCE